MPVSAFFVPNLERCSVRSTFPGELLASEYNLTPILAGLIRPFLLLIRSVFAENTFQVTTPSTTDMCNRRHLSRFPLAEWLLVQLIGRCSITDNLRCIDTPQEIIRALEAPCLWTTRIDTIGLKPRQAFHLLRMKPLSYGTNYIETLRVKIHANREAQKSTS